MLNDVKGEVVIEETRLLYKFQQQIILETRKSKRKKVTKVTSYKKDEEIQI